MASNIQYLPLEVFPLYNPRLEGETPAHEQIAQSFESIGTPQAARVAGQFREGLTSVDAFGGMGNLEGYFNRLLADRPRPEGAPIQQVGRHALQWTPESVELLQRNVEKQEANDRSLDLINRTIDGFGTSEVYDPDLDGAPELFGETQKWWNFVTPNIEDKWKLRIARDPKFLELPFEERKKVLSDDMFSGYHFRRLDEESQNAIVEKLSNPALRDAPNDVAVARMLDIPLKPANAGDMMEHYFDNILRSVGATGLLVRNAGLEFGAGTMNVISGALSKASEAPDATPEMLPVSEPLRQVVKLMSMASGEDPRDSAKKLSAWVRGGAQKMEEAHDQYDLTMPGPGDDIVKLAVTAPLVVARLGLIHKGLNLAKLGIATLPLDAYLGSQHLPKEAQKEATRDGAALAAILRVNAMQATPILRKAGSAIGFGAIAVRPQLDQAWQNPETFKLDKFAADIGPALAEGYLFESIYGHKRMNAKLRERAKGLSEATRIFVEGKNRHAAALAYSKLSLPDKIAFSRVMTPHMRTVLRSGQRDLGASVSGGAGRTEYKLAPTGAETAIRQHLAEEAPRAEIDSAAREAQTRATEVEGQWDPTIGDLTAEQMRGRAREDAFPRANLIPQELQGVTSTEDLLTQTARWVRGDGTFQDLLVVDIPPPTQTLQAGPKKGQKQIKRYPEADRNFELKPDPNNPPGFVSVFADAAKRRVRIHTEEPEKIIGAHPKNKLQEFTFPDDPRVPKNWRGRTIQVGNQTLDSMTERVQGNMSTNFKEAHDWYHNIQRAIPDFAGDMGLGKLTTEAWAPSQRNASPVSGMHDFLRAWEQMASGVFADGKRIKRAGVAHDQIMRAISGLRNYYRDSSKLADFSDLLYDAMPGTPRMHHRSAAGGDPRGLSPVAVDVHVGRARGWVDAPFHKQIVKTLAKLGDKKQLARAKKLKVDLAGAPTGNVYEESVKFANELSAHWKRQGFHPEVDHYPGGAQAVLWDVGSLSSVAPGANSPFDTIHAHRRVMAVEVEPADAVTAHLPGWRLAKDRYNSLTRQQQLDIAGTLGDWAAVEVMNRVGIVPMGREMESHFNAWDATPNAGSVIASYPSARNAGVAAEAHAWAGKQQEVWSWKASTNSGAPSTGSTTKAIALRIVDRKRDALIDTDTRIEVYEEIGRQTKGLISSGFTTTKHAGLERGEKTGITTLLDKEQNGGTEFAKLKKELTKNDGRSIEDAVAKASEKFGLDLEWGWSYADVYKAKNDWSKDPQGDEALRRLHRSGRGDVAEWLVREFGPEYERRLDRLIEKAEGDPDTYKRPPIVSGGAGPSARDFLRRKVAEELDPEMPPVAPAYRERGNPDVVYAAKPGQLHRDAAAAHRLGQKAHVDKSLESGFVDIRTGNWLTRKQADEFLPEWLGQDKRFGAPGQADASDFQRVQKAIGEGKVPKVSGGSGVDIKRAGAGFVDTRTGKKLTPEEAEELARYREEAEPREVLAQANLVPAVRSSSTGKEHVGRLGKDLFHSDIMKRRGLNPEEYSQHGFVDAETGQWFTEAQAHQRGARRASRRIPSVGGGVARRTSYPKPGIGSKTAKVYMPPPGPPGSRGIPRAGAGLPKWMNSTSILGPREQEYVETVLYRQPGETKLERKRRGLMGEKLTEKLAEQLADKYGVTPEQYMAASSGTMLTREQQMLGADFYHAASETAREAEIDMRAAQERGDGAAVEHARQAIASLNTKRAKLLMTLYASRSEAGRTLGSYRDLLPKAERHARRALKMIMEAEDLPEGARQRLVDRVINATNDNEITKVIWDSYKPTWWDKATEARIAFMLSSPVTIGRNLVGNAAHVAAMTAEEYTALGVDNLYEVGTRALKVPFNRQQSWDRRHARELFAMHYGQAAGMISGGRYAAAIIIDPKKPGDTRTMRQRIADAEANQAGGRIASEANIMPAIEGTKGAILRVPFRLQAMGDVLFYEMGRMMKLHQLAMRNAMNGTPGAPAPKGRQRLAAARIAVELAEQVPLQVRDSIAKGKTKAQNVTEAIAAEAHRTGLEVTFRSPLGRVPQYLNSIRHDKSLPGKAMLWSIPFMATPINVAKSVAQRAPLAGYVSPRNWKDLTSGDRATMTNAVARIGNGTLMFAILLELAREGYITGDAPNREMSDQMTAVGRPYNSVVMPGAGSYNYRGWSPMSEMLALAGNAAQREQIDGRLMTPEGAYRVGVGIARATMDQPFLTGVQDLSDVVNAPAGVEGDYKRNKFIERLASSVLIPRGVAWAARATDDQRRSFGRAESLPKGIALAALRDIPGVREHTPEYVDALGRSHETPEAWLQSFVIHSSDKPMSALDTWLNGLHDPLRPDKAVISQFSVKALGRIIGATTRNEMHRRRGEILVPELERIRTDEVVAEYPTNMQRDGVEKLVRATSERVWNDVIPLWELDHIGMEAKPSHVEAMQAIALYGPMAGLYTKLFHKNSERRAFVEAVVKGEVDLAATVAEQKVVMKEGEGQ